MNILNTEDLLHDVMPMSAYSCCIRLHTNCKHSASTELVSRCAAVLLRELSLKDVRRTGVLPVW